MTPYGPVEIYRRFPDICKLLNLQAFSLECSRQQVPSKRRHIFTNLQNVTFTSYQTSSPTLTDQVFDNPFATVFRFSESVSGVAKFFMII
jgi:hypothetical protein